ncbi:uncharacterized protein PV09_07591 [Verruconis gallopava]|uniref:Uncharacterized protein n=1 Tax=Verruconis gallopava TaxID=253628 RepID=A0A0D1XF47_9PEZI|nr:uncharacterized protein PV09_07591 [Verruconis gallopava]KIW00831.1 hypothetical protein PV09_07591 [Verruconis gallopava]
MKNSKPMTMRIFTSFSRARRSLRCCSYFLDLCVFDTTRPKFRRLCRISSVSLVLSASLALALASLARNCLKTVDSRGLHLDHSNFFAFLPLTSLTSLAFPTIPTNQREQRLRKKEWE